MFAWAVYDLVLSDRPEDLAESENLEATDEQDIEEPGDKETDEGNDKASDEANNNESDENVGLEKGNQAPDFELPTLEGDSVHLSDYLGKPVMLNFWASWCAPCRAEIPDMQKFYEDIDVEVVAVNLTTSEHSKDHVPEFVDEFVMR